MLQFSRACLTVQIRKNRCTKGLDRGPLLFLIYIKGLSNCLGDSIPPLLADDQWPRNNLDFGGTGVGIYIYTPGRIYF